MEGLPLLPGNSFIDRTKCHFPLKQTLQYVNGFRVPASYPNAEGLSQSDLDDLANFDPTLTYGKAKQQPPKQFIPAHVALDKKVLRFYGYFKETVNESPLEHYRVRFVVIYYYLEDDSIRVNEPRISNSGMPQGVLVARHKVPKNEVGDFYTWKDLNMGQNFCVYGRVYRITDCDEFTRSFLESEGVEIGEKETAPVDPYLERRTAAAVGRNFTTHSAYDQRRQFLEMDKKVLRFYAVGDDRDHMYGEARYYIIQFYLVDDTLEVRENHQPNDGRDPFPVLIKKGKIPKNRYDVSHTFPSISMELSDEEIKDYFGPNDLKIGETVVILGRRFLIYDCDNFTKAWYYKHFGMTDFTPVQIVGAQDKNRHSNVQASDAQASGPEETFMESHDKDTLAVKHTVDDDNGQRILRYEVILDSIRSEDRGRRFIMSYRLSDFLINIYEPPIRNSGIVGGTFLYRTRIAKPGSTIDKPEYYGPRDFYIGAKIEVFGNRFIVTNCDAFVLKYLENRKDAIPANVIESIRQKLSEGGDFAKGKKGKVTLRREEGDLNQMIREYRSQLKKMAITDKSRLDEMFLRYNRDRTGFISIANVQEMCRKMNLPEDEDIITALIEQHGANGKMDLEQFRKFMEE